MLFYKKPNFDKMSEELIKKAKAINNINKEIVFKVKYKADFHPYEMDVDSFIISEIEYFDKNDQKLTYNSFDATLLCIYNKVIKDARCGKKTTKRSIYGFNLEEINVFIIYLYLLGFNFKYKIIQGYKLDTYYLDLKIDLLDDKINKIYHYALDIYQFKIISISERCLNYHRYHYIFEEEYKKKFENKKKLLLIQNHFYFDIVEHNTITMHQVLRELYPEINFELVNYHRQKVIRAVSKNG